MPRQEDKTVEAVLKREEVNGDPYDVLYINDKEIVAFHLNNIENLKLEHTSQSMFDAVSQLFSIKSL